MGMLEYLLHKYVGVNLIPRYLFARPRERGEILLSVTQRVESRGGANLIATAATFLFFHLYKPPKKVVSFWQKLSAEFLF